MSGIHEFTGLVFDDPMRLVVAVSTLSQQVKEPPKVIHYDDKNTIQVDVDLND